MIKTKGTLIGYGPDDKTVTKLVASALNKGTDTIIDQKKWFSMDSLDLRNNQVVTAEIVAFFKRYKVSAPMVVAKVLGCPHEEGIDYPEGQECPNCDYWKGKDRWTSI